MAQGLIWRIIVKRKILTLVFVLPSLIPIMGIGQLMAQPNGVPEETQMEDEVLRMEGILWASYNDCNLNTFPTLLTDDLEFYHDKGGLTVGAEALVESIESGICGNKNWRLRREAVAGSPKIYPLREDGILYGAIASGEHAFYVVEENKEKLDGFANFTHVWLYKNDVWKISRILSYDHRPYNNQDEEGGISLADEILSQYAGNYKSSQGDGRIVVIRKENGFLRLEDGDFKVDIYPKSETIFFHKERDLEFEFIKGNGNEVEKMIVRQQGSVVEELNRGISGRPRRDGGS